MKLLILFGPPAVGKMTVGSIIEERSSFKLFHNHQIVDGVMHIFGRNSEVEDRLSREIRERIITTAATEKINLIFTYVWNFSRQKGKDNIDVYKAAYESRGGEVLFVELIAPTSTRAQRADSTDRYLAKPHAPGPTEILHDDDAKFRCPEPFYYPDQYARIDTANRTPEAVADEILALL